MSSNIRTLGDKGSNLLTELSRQGKRLFSFEDAAKVYGSGDGRLRKMLFTLVKRRWLQRIEKGKYLILPFEAGREGEWTEHEFVIASHLIEPYYIGFRSAINYYGYTEQVSRTIFIASTKRKLKPSLEISGVTYRFVYLKEQKFFGMTEVLIDSNRVNISDREKTIADCLDLLEYSGGLVEVAKAISFGRNELDFIKMADYARRNGNRAAGKRLGYLLEVLDIKADTAVSILRENLGNSYALLDALADPQGQHIQRWRIIANIPEKELMQWKAVG